MKWLLKAVIVMTLLFHLLIFVFLWLCKTFPDELLGPPGQRIGKDTVTYWDDGEWQIMNGVNEYHLFHMGNSVVQGVVAYGADESNIYVIGREQFVVIEKGESIYKQYSDIENYEEATGLSLSSIIFKYLN